MIKVVIFDLDDTLIAESDFAFSAFREISKFISAKFQIAENNVFMEMVDIYSVYPNKVFDTFYNLHNMELSVTEKNRLIDLYRNHKPDIQLSNEVKATLIELKNKGYKIGLITDGWKVTQWNKIDSLKLVDYFDNIIVTDDYGREFWKPNSRAFYAMKNFFNVEFSEMVYIGDNPFKDIETPKELGMLSILLLSKYSIYQKNTNISEINVRKICSLSDLLHLEKSYENTNDC